MKIVPIDIINKSFKRKMAGYDPEKCSGFAFGVGIERVAMLKYGIDDIRHFYTNDKRFNSTFKRYE